MLLNKYLSIIKRMIIGWFFLPTVIIGTSCNKYLDKKPDQSVTIPSKLADLQAVLDDQKGNFSPGYLELVADNYYVTSAIWSASGNTDQRLNYVWDKSANIAVDNYIWSNPYSAIYEANFVLDLLPEIDVKVSDAGSYNSIKGTALFYRSFQFFQLAQLFCKPYSGTAADDEGIVLKLSSKVTDHYVRSTVQQTYDQIIADLSSAVSLLPASTLYKTRPNKAAAYGMLARVYLSVRNYTKAALYADSALRLVNTLLDYNNLLPAANPSLPENYINNPEVIFVSSGGADLLNPPRPIIDSNLYQSYNNNDLRKNVFFGSYTGNTYYWKGSYHSTAQYFSVFCGLTTDELYLIRAESNVRIGNVSAAMSDLNTLMRKRWKTGTFNDITATDANDGLNKILVERRKELIFRGLRWSDLRRLNQEGANLTLKRIINNIEYTLPPNDLRWVLPIPDVEVNRSGIEQNPR
jgi:starch-binding outer membrane protein, SusD/RagB family